MMQGTTIGERIRRLREERGMTQEELGKALHVSREAVKMWENGDRDIKTKHTIALADFFGVPSDYLLGRTECRSMDVDLQAFCKKTGLNDISLETLESFSHGEDILDNGADWMDEYKESILKFINCLFSYDGFGYLVDLARDIIEMEKSSSNLEKDMKDFISERPKTRFAVHPIEYNYLIEYKANRSAQRLADMMYRLMTYGTTHTKEYITPQTREEFEIIIKEQYAKRIKELNDVRKRVQEGSLILPEGETLLGME